MKMDGLTRSLFCLLFVLHLSGAFAFAASAKRAFIQDQLADDLPRCGIPNAGSADPFGLGAQFVKSTTTTTTTTTPASTAASSTSTATSTATSTSKAASTTDKLIDAKDSLPVAAGQTSSEIFLTGLGPDVNEVTKLQADITAEARRKVIPRMVRQVALPERSVVENQLCWQVKITVLVRASPGRYAYLTCAGTLVGARTVVTAAHCLTNPFMGSTTSTTFQKPDQVTVRIGDTSGDVCVSDDEDGCTEYLMVSKITSHPAYNAVLGNNDIAILTLERPIDFANKTCACSLCLRRKAPAVGEKCAVSGNGDQVTVAGRVIAPFRWSVLEVLQANISTADCGFNVDDATGNVTNIADFICARGDKNQDSCQGDSGGPLVCMDSSSTNYYLAGVMSFGPPCGVNIGAMYTMVNSFVPWIISNTGNDVQLAA